MARTEITMPQLGETVTEGTITRWIKQVGEEVKADDLLFEVSTDKVDSEVPSPESGFLVEILVEEGETVEVGTPIAVIGDSADDAGEASPPQEEAAEADAQEPAAPEAEPSEPADAESPGEPDALPLEERGGEERPAERPAEGLGEGIVLSPVVRRLMAEYDVDPSQVQGTGAGGRITRNDVLDYIERDRGGEAPAPTRPEPEKPAAEKPAAEKPAAERPAAEKPAAEQPTTPAPAPAAQTAPSAPRFEGDEVIAMSNIRKRTAEHMVRSKATSAHVMMSVEVDFEGVERVRAKHREEFRAEEGFSLTYLPFIARAVCDAIAEYPIVNASVDGDDLVVHQAVNLGIAVDLDFEGLIVPVIRNADGLRLRHLARSIRDLADRARNKQLSPDEVTGGTYTITNPGPYDTYVSAPVINQPQVAILSTEGIRKRPVVVESDNGDSIAIRHVGVLSQSFDHRAFDGAYCAAFLGHLREIIETRDWEQEIL